MLSNSRGPDSLKEDVAALGTGAVAATIQDAAREGIVVLGVPWLKIHEALRNLPAWNNRILIDATNQFVSPTELMDLQGRISSEIVAGLAPGARVVKALNNLFVERLSAGPVVPAGRRITFISGDDREAKGSVAALLEQIGFAVVDLGSLHVGGLTQQAGGPLAGLDLVLGT